MPDPGKLQKSHCRRLSSSPTWPLLFYKLIVSSILQAKRLKIPQKFVKRSGDQLSAVTTLTLPKGGVWHVGLKKDNKKFWFFHGWHDFVEYYSIQVGYFLIFKYEGNSKFDVKIYDLAASEINYPSHNLRSSEKTRDASRKEMNIDDEDDDHDNAETSGSAPHVSFRNTRFDQCVDQKPVGIDCIEDLRLEKDGDDLQSKILSTRDVGIQFNGQEPTDSGCICSEAANGKAKRKRNELDAANESSAEHKEELDQPGLAYTSKQRRRSVTLEEKKTAIHSAENFRPNNPFCRIVLRQSYIHEKAILHIPRRFSEKYLDGVSKFITLQGSDGKEWSVRCISYGKGLVKLASGWTMFVKDNNLEEGDVCVFELINTGDVVLKVSIFRVI